MTEQNIPIVMKHVLIIVENLPVPLDRRVWQEATALTEAGYEVSVICPATERFPKRYERIDGVNVYRHPLWEASSMAGYLLEYPMALLFQFLLAVRIWTQNRFDVIHGCNPPDLAWIIALLFRPMNVRYVFDHHDVNPELFEAKFGRKGLLYRCLLWMECMNFAAADRAIATNRSFRDRAVERGGMEPDHVYVVRNAPDLASFDRFQRETEPVAREGITVGYVGMMGKQDGLDLLLQAADVVRNRRPDVTFTLIGDGPYLPELKDLRDRLELGDHVTFPGIKMDEELVAELCGADVCVNPEPVTPMNDVSTMNKVLEYMALGKPIVQFDRTEGRRSAGKASLYATDNDPQDFAEKIIELVDDPGKRERMGRIGRQRLEEKLSWSRQREQLIRLYDELTDR